jgi:hypothetical protein
MRSFITLLISTVILWILIISFSICLPPLTGDHPDTRPFNFLPWLPGISIALLSGVAGAFFNGMLEIHRSIANKVSEEPAKELDLVYYVIRPFLGAMAGMIVFFFVAAGGLSLTPQIQFTGNENLSVGALIYDYLTPRSAVQLATIVTLTFVGGYFFASVAELFEALWRRTLKNGRPER